MKPFNIQFSIILLFICLSSFFHTSSTLNELKETKQSQSAELNSLELLRLFFRQHMKDNSNYTYTSESKSATFNQSCDPTSKCTQPERCISGICDCPFGFEPQFVHKSGQFVYDSCTKLECRHNHDCLKRYGHGAECNVFHECACVYPWFIVDQDTQKCAFDQTKSPKIGLPKCSTDSDCHSKLEDGDDYYCNTVIHHCLRLYPNINDVWRGLPEGTQISIEPENESKTTARKSNRLYLIPILFIGLFCFYVYESRSSWATKLRTELGLAVRSYNEQRIVRANEPVLTSYRNTTVSPPNRRQFSTGTINFQSSVMNTNRQEEDASTPDLPPPYEEAIQNEPHIQIPIENRPTTITIVQTHEKPPPYKP